MRKLLSTIFVYLFLSLSVHGDALDKELMPRINSYFVKCELDIDKSYYDRWIIFNIKSEFFGLRTKLTLFDFWEGSFSNVTKTVFINNGIASFNSILNKDFDTMQFRNSSSDEEFIIFNETRRARHRKLGWIDDYKNCFWFDEM